MRADPLVRRHLFARYPARWRIQTRSHASSLFSRSERTVTVSGGSPSRFDLPDKPARTRFAPSPTGYLHLGSLRTALFNYLLARATHGQFLIRVEDTDQTRLVADAEQRLYDDLKWAGLSWDEGPDGGGPFGPYRQSERLSLYRTHADILLREGRAFRCFCSKEALELHQSTHHACSGTTARYPGTCLNISMEESEDRAASGEPHTIRFRSEPDPVEALDLVYGKYKKAEREDDFIIIKSDGFPTYHFANVVDDHYMEITHVIRGAEWLISTPKHVELYNAFGWIPPQFIHVGLLVDMKRQKLSKRDWANVGISSYRDQGILPPALLNFVAMLGWSPHLRDAPGIKKGVLTLRDMIHNFSLRFTKGDIVVDTSKLEHLQSRHATRLIQEERTTSKALTDLILTPIEQAVRRLEDARLDPDLSRKEQPAEDQDLSNSLGSCLHPLGPGEALKPYIHWVLRSWNGSYKDPVSFLRDNRYLFWRIPAESLHESFIALITSVQSVSIDGDVMSVPQVLRFFADRLSAVDSVNWSTDAIGSVVQSLVCSVSVVESSSTRRASTGGAYKFLRWALLSSMPGSQIVAAMGLLGKDETIKRLAGAAVVASGTHSPG